MELDHFFCHKSVCALGLPTFRSVPFHEWNWNRNGKFWNWNGTLIFWMELERNTNFLDGTGTERQFFGWNWNGTLITVPFRVGTLRCDFHLIHQKVDLIESFSPIFVQFRQKYSNLSSNQAMRNGKIV